MSEAARDSVIEGAKQQLRELLEKKPPGSHVEGVFAFKQMNARGSAEYVVYKPILTLHCENCDGTRHFDTEADARVSLGQMQGMVFAYLCRNCHASQKWFGLVVEMGDKQDLEATIRKIGEYPPFGPPIPARLITLIGGDRELFLKGRRAESQSLGIGAFAYYRRVVEDQRDRLLCEIIRVAELVGSPETSVDTLKAAKSEQQFAKSLEMVKDVIPDVLKIQGHNPITLLHRALSEGIHSLSDEDCLSRANAIRTVLIELAERLGQLLKDNSELKNAISSLLNPKPGSA